MKIREGRNNVFTNESVFFSFFRSTENMFIYRPVWSCWKDESESLCAVHNVVGEKRRREKYFTCARLNNIFEKEKIIHTMKQPTHINTNYPFNNMKILIFCCFLHFTYAVRCVVWFSLEIFRVGFLYLAFSVQSIPFLSLGVDKNMFKFLLFTVWLLRLSSCPTLKSRHYYCLAFVDCCYYEHYYVIPLLLIKQQQPKMKNKKSREEIIWIHTRKTAHREYIPGLERDCFILYSLAGGIQLRWTTLLNFIRIYD